MVWYTATCSYDDWQRSYKRSHGVAHNHPAQTNFKRDVQNLALNELHTSGQARYMQAGVNNLRISSFQVNLPNDPGANYRQI